MDATFFFFACTAVLYKAALLRTRGALSPCKRFPAVAGEKFAKDKTPCQSQAGKMWPSFASATASLRVTAV